MLSILLGAIVSIPVAGPLLIAGGAAVGPFLGRILTNKYVLAVIAGAIALGAADLHGRHAEQVKCDSRLELQRQLSTMAAKKRDAAIAADLEQKYGRIFSGLKQETAELNREVNDYVTNSFKDPGIAHCQLGPAADELRPKKRRR